MPNLYDQVNDPNFKPGVGMTEAYTTKGGIKTVRSLATGRIWLDSGKSSAITQDGWYDPSDLHAGPNDGTIPGGVEPYVHNGIRTMRSTSSGQVFDPSTRGWVVPGGKTVEETIDGVTFKKKVDAPASAPSRRSLLADLAVKATPMHFFRDISETLVDAFRPEGRARIGQGATQAAVSTLQGAPAGIESTVSNAKLPGMGPGDHSLKSLFAAAGNTEGTGLASRALKRLAYGAKSQDEAARLVEESMRSNPEINTFLNQAKTHEGTPFMGTNEFKAALMAHEQILANKAAGKVSNQEGTEGVNDFSTLFARNLAALQAPTDQQLQAAVGNMLETKGLQVAGADTEKTLLQKAALQELAGAQTDDEKTWDERAQSASARIANEAVGLLPMLATSGVASGVAKAAASTAGKGILKYTPQAIGSVAQMKALAIPRVAAAIAAQGAGDDDAVRNSLIREALTVPVDAAFGTPIGNVMGKRIGKPSATWNVANAMARGQALGAMSGVAEIASRELGGEDLTWEQMLDQMSTSVGHMTGLELGMKGKSLVGGYTKKGQAGLARERQILGSDHVEGEGGKSRLESAAVASKAADFSARAMLAVENGQGLRARVKDYLAGTKAASLDELITSGKLKDEAAAEALKLRDAIRANETELRALHGLIARGNMSASDNEIIRPGAGKSQSEVIRPAQSVGAPAAMPTKEAQSAKETAQKIESMGAKLTEPEPETEVKTEPKANTDLRQQAAMAPEMEAPKAPEVKPPDVAAEKQAPATPAPLPEKPRVEAGGDRRAVTQEADRLSDMISGKLDRAVDEADLAEAMTLVNHFREAYGKHEPTMMKNIERMVEDARDNIGAVSFRDVEADGPAPKPAVDLPEPYWVDAETGKVRTSLGKIRAFREALAKAFEETPIRGAESSMKWLLKEAETLQAALEGSRGVPKGLDASLRVSSQDPATGIWAKQMHQTYQALAKGLHHERDGNGNLTERAKQLHAWRRGYLFKDGQKLPEYTPYDNQSKRYLYDTGNSEDRAGGMNRMAIPKASEGAEPAGYTLRSHPRAHDLVMRRLEQDPLLGERYRKAVEHGVRTGRQAASDSEFAHSDRVALGAGMVGYSPEFQRGLLRQGVSEVTSQLESSVESASARLAEALEKTPEDVKTITDLRAKLENQKAKLEKWQARSSEILKQDFNSIDAEDLRSSKRFASGGVLLDKQGVPVLDAKGNPRRSVVPVLREGADATEPGRSPREGNYDGGDMLRGDADPTSNRYSVEYHRDRKAWDAAIHEVMAEKGMRKPPVVTGKEEDVPFWFKENKVDPESAPEGYAEFWERVNLIAGEFKKGISYSRPKNVQEHEADVVQHAHRTAMGQLPGTLREALGNPLASPELRAEARRLYGESFKQARRSYEEARARAQESEAEYDSKIRTYNRKAAEVPQELPRETAIEILDEHASLQKAALKETSRQQESDAIDFASKTGRSPRGVKLTWQTEVEQAALRRFLGKPDAEWNRTGIEDAMKEHWENPAYQQARARAIADFAGRLNIGRTVGGAKDSEYSFTAFTAFMDRMERAGLMLDFNPGKVSYRDEAGTKRYLSQDAKAAGWRYLTPDQIETLLAPGQIMRRIENVSDGEGYVRKREDNGKPLDTHEATVSEAMLEASKRDLSRKLDEAVDKWRNLVKRPEVMQLLWDTGVIRKEDVIPGYDYERKAKAAAGDLMAAMRSVSEAASPEVAARLLEARKLMAQTMRQVEETQLKSSSREGTSEANPRAMAAEIRGLLPMLTESSPEAPAAVKRFVETLGSDLKESKRIASLADRLAASPDDPVTRKALRSVLLEEAEKAQAEMGRSSRTLTKVLPEGADPARPETWPTSREGLVDGPDGATEIFGDFGQDRRERGHVVGLGDKMRVNAGLDAIREKFPDLLDGLSPKQAAELRRAMVNLEQQAEYTDQEAWLVEAHQKTGTRLGDDLMLGGQKMGMGDKQDLLSEKAEIRAGMRDFVNSVDESSRVEADADTLSSNPGMSGSDHSALPGRRITEAVREKAEEGVYERGGLFRELVEDAMAELKGERAGDYNPTTTEVTDRAIENLRARLGVEYANDPLPLQGLRREVVTQHWSKTGRQHLVDIYDASRRAMGLEAGHEGLIDRFVGGTEGTWDLNGAIESLALDPDRNQSPLVAEAWSKAMGDALRLDGSKNQTGLKEGAFGIDAASKAFSDYLRKYNGRTMGKTSFPKMSPAEINDHVADFRSRARDVAEVIDAQRMAHEHIRGIKEFFGALDPRILMAIAPNIQAGDTKVGLEGKAGSFNSRTGRIELNRDHALATAAMLRDTVGLMRDSRAYSQKEMGKALLKAKSEASRLIADDLMHESTHFLASYVDPDVVNRIRASFQEARHEWLETSATEGMRELFSALGSPESAARTAHLSDAEFKALASRMGGDAKLVDGKWKVRTEGDAFSTFAMKRGDGWLVGWPAGDSSYHWKSPDEFVAQAMSTLLRKGADLAWMKKVSNMEGNASIVRGRTSADSHVRVEGKLGGNLIANVIDLIDGTGSILEASLLAGKAGLEGPVVKGEGNKSLRPTIERMTTEGLNSLKDVKAKRVETEGHAFGTDRGLKGLVRDIMIDSISESRIVHADSRRKTLEKPGASSKGGQWQMMDHPEREKTLTRKVKEASAIEQSHDVSPSGGFRRPFDAADALDDPGVAYKLTERDAVLSGTVTSKVLDRRDKPGKFREALAEGIVNPAQRFGGKTKRAFKSMDPERSKVVEVAKAGVQSLSRMFVAKAGQEAWVKNLTTASVESIKAASSYAADKLWGGSLAWERMRGMPGEQRHLATEAEHLLAPGYTKYVKRAASKATESLGPGIHAVDVKMPEGATKKVYVARDTKGVQAIATEETLQFFDYIRLKGRARNDYETTGFDALSPEMRKLADDYIPVIDKLASMHFETMARDPNVNKVALEDFIQQAEAKDMIWMPGLYGSVGSLDLHSFDAGTFNPDATMGSRGRGRYEARIHDTFREAMRHGFLPKFYNPAEQFMSGFVEQVQYGAHAGLIRRYKESNLVVHASPELMRRAGAGDEWIEINSSILGGKAGELYGLGRNDALLTKEQIAVYRGAMQKLAQAEKDGTSYELTAEEQAAMPKVYMHRSIYDYYHTQFGVGMGHTKAYQAVQTLNALGNGAQLFGVFHATTVAGGFGSFWKLGQLMSTLPKIAIKATVAKLTNRTIEQNPADFHGYVESFKSAGLTPEQAHEKAVERMQYEAYLSGKQNAGYTLDQLLAKHGHLPVDAILSHPEIQPAEKIHLLAALHAGLSVGKQPMMESWGEKHRIMAGHEFSQAGPLGRIASAGKWAGAGIYELIQGAQSNLMGGIVNQVKKGFFVSELNKVLREHPSFSQENFHEVVAKELRDGTSVLAKNVNNLVDTLDNVFGMANFQKMALDPSVKSWLQMLERAYTWHKGTNRLLFHAADEVLSMGSRGLGRLAGRGKDGKITDIYGAGKERFGGKRMLDGEKAYNLRFLAAHMAGQGIFNLLMVAAGVAALGSQDDEQGALKRFRNALFLKLGDPKNPSVDQNGVPYYMGFGYTHELTEALYNPKAWAKQLLLGGKSPAYNLAASTYKTLAGGPRTASSAKTQDVLDAQMADYEQSGKLLENKLANLFILGGRTRRGEEPTAATQLAALMGEVGDEVFLEKVGKRLGRATVGAVTDLTPMTLGAQQKLQDIKATPGQKVLSLVGGRVLNRQSRAEMAGAEHEE